MSGALTNFGNDFAMWTSWRIEGCATTMRYTSGEVTGIAATTLAIAAVGLGLRVADPSPHYQPPRYTEGASEDSGAMPPPGMGAASAGADFARPGAVPMASSSASPSRSPSPEPSPLLIKRVLPISGPIRYGEFHWNEAGAPAAGPLVITVDLEARTISVFRDGYEIGAAAVLLGTQEKPTPVGVFPITEKDARHMSNLYDAPMPYMMRLTNDGVSIHATTVQNGYASHGCIGVPLGFAKKLFGVARLGDKVYVTRGKRVGVGDNLT